ncbi:MAG: hypothetical protein EOP53_02640, partial [Sphingobacteriales bacterium]
MSKRGMRNVKPLINLAYNHLNNEEFTILYYKLDDLAEKIGEIVREYRFRRTIHAKQDNLLALTYSSRITDKFNGGFGIWLDEKAYPPVFNINIWKQVKIRNYYYRIWEYIIEKKSVEELIETVEIWIPKVIEFY